MSCRTDLPLRLTPPKTESRAKPLPPRWPQRRQVARYAQPLAGRTRLAHDCRNGDGITHALHAQCIDDESQKTLLFVSDKILGQDIRHVKIDNAHELGLKLAQLAVQKGIGAVIFDRGSRAYHGRVKAFAEGARKGGLKF